jgi:hypothetical protein
MPRNYFQDPLETGQNAFDQAYDRQQAVTDRITTSRAGRQLAGGDRSGAASTFARGGMIGPARQMQADQQSADNREAEMAAGEQEVAQKMAAQRVKALKMIADGLKPVPVGQRSQALQQALPVLESIGVEPGPFAGLTEDQLSDANLAMFGAELDKQYQQIFQNETGIYGARPDGKVDTLQEFSPKPTIVPQGSVAVGRDGRPMFTNPKTFAPARGGGRRRSSGGGGIPPLPPGAVMEK